METLMVLGNTHDKQVTSRTSIRRKKNNNIPNEKKTKNLEVKVEKAQKERTVSFTQTTNIKKKIRKKIAISPTPPLLTTRGRCIPNKTTDNNAGKIKPKKRLLVLLQLLITNLPKLLL